MERITSIKNPLLSHIRRLLSSRAYREEQGEFVCDGKKLLQEALQWYPHIKTVLLTEKTPCPPLPEGVRTVEIPLTLMESLSEMKTPQGILFTCTLPGPSPVRPQRGMLILDRIQDPGNLGTILRTADALGVPVLLTNDCADAFSGKTIRASMGAVLRSPPPSLPLDTLLEQIVQAQIPLAATALTPSAADLRSLDLNDYAVIIGSEGQGVCPALLQASQKQLIIPMQPRCESLNAAVAAAIVMWQMKQ